MTLAICLATRNRAPLLLKTLDTTLRNVSRDDTVLMVAADRDDEATISMVRELAAIDKRLVLSVGDRKDTVAAKWNQVLTRIEADVYMPMCDDGPVITQGFDRKVLDAAASFPDQVGVVFNHLENLSFTGIQAVTRPLAVITGHIYPELFPYWFVDHWLSDVAEMIDRIAFADVRLDCATNRPPTMEMREPAFWATFYDACRSRRHAEADAVLNSAGFATPSWQKLMLRGRRPLVDQYSRMINDGVRTMRPSSEPEPDERYKRIKAAALNIMRTELLPELEHGQQATAA